MNIKDGLSYMAEKPESRLQRKIKKALERSIGGWWIKIHGGPYQASGIPDLLGCVDGLFFAFEVKCPGKIPTKIQIETIKDIIEVKGVALVVESSEEAIDVVQKALRSSKNSRRLRSKSKNSCDIRKAKNRKNMDNDECH